MNRFGLFILVSFIVLTGCVNDAKYAGLSMEDRHVEERVDSLMNLMTLQEKVGQLNQYHYWFTATGPVGGERGDAYKFEDIKNGWVGTMLNVVGPKTTRLVQQYAVDSSRLGIPLFIGYDVVHGYHTVTPIPLGEAASFDLEAIEKSARIAAVEATADGVHWTFAPMVDVARDARWGRILEGAGEDTWYGSLVAASRVKGFQGDDLSDTTTMLACAKHFIAYGAPVAGRDYNTVDMSLRELYEVYLPPFKAALDAGCQTYMNAFNDLSGVPCTGNEFLVKDILKGDWAFDGMVTSDWNSVGEMIMHRFAKDTADAAVKALKAGCDSDMMGHIYRTALVQEIEKGHVSEELLDDGVRRVLRMKFRLGLFEDPFKYCNKERADRTKLAPEHRAAARDMVRKSCVLLKNENNTLPLKKSIRTLALIGPMAANERDVLGAWKGLGEAENTVTLLEGIHDKLGNSVRVMHAKGCNIDDDSTQYFQKAINAAKYADAIVLAVGENWRMAGESASRTNLKIPGKQIELMKKIKRLGKPIIVVVYSGRPLALNWTSKYADAILEVWQPGTEGGHAIADILFGDYNPSAKLPVTFPHNVGQEPLYYNYKSTGRPYQENNPWSSSYLDVTNHPIYPFGHGLSYTTFDYSAIQLDSKSMKKDGSILAKVIVENTGSVAGEEVVQLYIRDDVASITRPVKELRGFEKISLEAGESKEVSFVITKEDLSFYNMNLEYIVEAGTFTVFIGTSSEVYKETIFTLVD